MSPCARKEQFLLTESLPDVIQYIGTTSYIPGDIQYSVTPVASPVTQVRYHAVYLCGQSLQGDTEVLMIYHICRYLCHRNCIGVSCTCYGAANFLTDCCATGCGMFHNRVWPNWLTASCSGADFGLQIRGYQAMSSPIDCLSRLRVTWFTVYPACFVTSHSP